MIKYQSISAYDVKQRSLKEPVKIVDIRDAHTYENDHIEGAFHLTNASLSHFIEDVSVDIPIYVICYHGNSSKGVAQYLCEQGYVDVYNVEGGMAGWRLIDPRD